MSFRESFQNTLVITKFLIRVSVALLVYRVMCRPKSASVKAFCLLLCFEEFSFCLVYLLIYLLAKIEFTRMWANAQPDGRPAEHRWCPLFNAAKFG